MKAIDINEVAAKMLVDHCTAHNMTVRIPLTLVDGTLRASALTPLGHAVCFEFADAEQAIVVMSAWADARKMATEQVKESVSDKDRFIDPPVFVFLQDKRSTREFVPGNEELWKAISELESAITTLRGQCEAMINRIEHLDRH